MRKVWLIVFVLAAVVLAACSSTPAPEVVQETVEVIVTQEVEKEVEVTRQVEVVVTQEVEKEVVKEVEVTGLPAANPMEVTGNIVSAGSSTVYPLSERMAERFRDEGFGGNMTYGQTLGLTQNAPVIGNWEALRWGLLGTTIKGAIWIGFAGLFLGMGLGGKRYRPCLLYTSPSPRD